MRFIHGPMAWFLSVVLTMVPMVSTQAKMLDTDQIVNSTQPDPARDKIQHFLTQEATKQQLLAWGVSPDWVRERVSSLTNTELVRINQQVDNLPAGGNGILGILLIIFIVFVITDVIGATDIFPFIHPVK